MHNQDFCVATISLARTTEEEQWLRASLPALSLLNVPVVVTDGGSSKNFLRFLEGLQNFTVLQAPAKGLFAQARHSLQEAAKLSTRFIFYTEPDKKDFFQSGLPAIVSATEASDHLGVLMASRTAKSFGSFPGFQQMTEAAINNCCEELIGLKTDYCYGPFLLNKNLVEHLAELKEDVGWGWRPFVFNVAHRLGYKVNSFESDFYCPETQREDDPAERVYRMKQLEQNIRGLVASTTVKRRPEP